MTSCTICRFETELDDIALTGGGDRCVCLRCFSRETGTARPMPRALRHALSAVVNGAEVV
jgi:hypothetical protein